jgi:hypothetical protein
LTDRRKGPQGGTNVCRHVAELPADLFLDGFWPIGVREADGFGGICGGAKCVRAHMADGDGLSGGSGSGRCGGGLHITSADATDKPTADLLRGVQLSPGECAGPSDQSPRAVIARRLSLEQP